MRLSAACMKLALRGVMLAVEVSFVFQWIDG
jgi:hypothetical protein